MDPKKVAVLNTWPTPLKKCNMQSFLGFCNFFRCFIQGFSAVTCPLSQLMGNSEWSWDEKEQLAFEELKCQITEYVTLTISLDDGKFQIEADS